MPIIYIKVTPQSVSAEQKRRLIAGATELVAQVLDKDPATTFVLIEEIDPLNWGVAGEPVLDRLEARR
ncbi:MAG: tautomerase family protein [Gammaproteobacteria bacterium]